MRWTSSSPKNGNDHRKSNFKLYGVAWLCVALGIVILLSCLVWDSGPGPYAGAWWVFARRGRALTVFWGALLINSFFSLVLSDPASQNLARHVLFLANAIGIPFLLLYPCPPYALALQLSEEQVWWAHVGWWTPVLLQAAVFAWRFAPDKSGVAKGAVAITMLVTFWIASTCAKAPYESEFFGFILLALYPLVFLSMLVNLGAALASAVTKSRRGR